MIKKIRKFANKNENCIKLLNKGSSARMLFKLTSPNLINDRGRMNFYCLLAAIVLFSLVSSSQSIPGSVKAWKSMFKFSKLGGVLDIDERNADVDTFLNDAIKRYALFLFADTAVVSKIFQGRTNELLSSCFEFLADHMFSDATAEQVNMHLGNVMDV